MNRQYSKQRTMNSKYSTASERSLPKVNGTHSEKNSRIACSIFFSRSSPRETRDMNGKFPGSIVRSFTLNKQKFFFASQATSNKSPWRRISRVRNPFRKSDECWEVGENRHNETPRSESERSRVDDIPGRRRPCRSSHSRHRSCSRSTSDRRTD